MSKKEETPDTRRLTAPEIFEAAIENAREELRRSPRTLAFSGIAGGLTMGLTGLGVAAVRAILGPGSWQDFVSFFIYPIGFIAVIIGRAQLFTENTLYPVILILDEHRYFGATAKLWAVVYTSNIVGAAAFALLAVRSGALRQPTVEELLKLGTDAALGPAAHIFWSGIIGGWLIALVAWVVTASHWTIGQVIMVWLLTFIVGVAKLSHCIASSGEILSAVVAGVLPLGSYIRWIVPATLGNIVGRVFIVSMLNYGQVRAS